MKNHTHSRYLGTVVDETHTHAKIHTNGDTNDHQKAFCRLYLETQTWKKVARSAFRVKFTSHQKTNCKQVFSAQRLEPFPRSKIDHAFVFPQAADPYDEAIQETFHDPDYNATYRTRSSDETPTGITGVNAWVGSHVVTDWLPATLIVNPWK